MSTTSPPPLPPPWLLTPDKGVLSESQMRQLETIFARLWPEDASRFIPGAVRLGACRFVSLLLARPPEVYREISVWRVFYPRVLEALENWAQETHKTGITALSDAQMITALKALESKALVGFPDKLALPEFPNETYDQARVFITLLRHCWQGCAADPRWGGNDDKLFWRCIGYAQPAEDIAFAAAGVDEREFLKPESLASL